MIMITIILGDTDEKIDVVWRSLNEKKVKYLYTLQAQTWKHGNVQINNKNVLYNFKILTFTRFTQ